MKRLLMFTALLTLFLFPSCAIGGNSSSDTTQSQSSNTQASKSAEGYLDNEDTQVIYVQWTESNGQLTGSWNAAVFQNNKIDYTNIPITGTHNNETGTINFALNLSGKQAAISGKLQNDNLQLQMQQNGEIKTWKLYPASNVEYRSVFDAFKAKYQSS